VDSETPLDKIISIVKEFKIKVDTLIEEFNIIEKRIKEIRNAKGIMKQIVNNSEVRKRELNILREEDL
jgi:hypothetical protein